MPRRRYYRRSVRVVPAKKKWASNITQGGLGTASGFNQAAVLVANSSQSSSPTPVILKVGNFKVQGDFHINAGSGGSNIGPIFVFIVFVPEGIDASGTNLTGVIGNHPEWVMNWVCVDTPSFLTASNYQSGNKFSLSTRMKRNLNSGDKVFIYAQSTQMGSGITFRLDYTAQFFTCSN